MAPPRELDIKRMVKARESNGFDENGGSFVALKLVGIEGTDATPVCWKGAPFNFHAGK